MHKKPRVTLKSMWKKAKHEWTPLVAKCFPTFGLDRDRKRIYSVGLPRSGTKSVADLLSPYMQTAHEPLYKETIVHLIKWKKGKYTNEEMKRILELRDWRLGIGAESSHFMHYFVPIIKETFRNSIFIMTIREPLGWIESEFEQNMITRNMKYWKKVEKFRYGKYQNEYKIDRIKKEKNLYPIKSYLDYWTDHTCYVEKNLDNEELLNINTYEINDRKKEIGDHCGVELDKSKNVHSNKGREEKKIYEYIEKEDLVNIIKKHSCSKEIRKKFPFLIEDMEYID